MSATHDDLAASFTNALALHTAGDSGAARCAASPDLGARLEAMWSEARAAWPDVTLPGAVFAAHLAGRLPDGPDAGSTPDALDALRAPDLYLARACADGDRAALAAFDRTHMGRVRRTLARMKLDSGEVDDLLQVIRFRLLVATEHKPAKILDYRGRGDLGRWLRVVAVREAGAMIRRRAREVPVTRDELADAAEGLAPAQLSLVGRRYREPFRRALAAAVAALQPRDRNLLRMDALEGLNHDQIAAVYSVHRTTALRWLARARERLVSEVHARLRRELGVDRRELDSLLVYLQSHISMSLGGLLADRESAA